MTNKLISKLFKTTLILFIIITIYTIPTLKTKQNVLRTNLEIEDATNIPSTKIYLLNKNDQLVQASVLINNKDKSELIKSIISYLTINNNDIPVGLKNYIPENTRLLNIEIEDNIVKLDLSKELLNTKNINNVITGIVYSIISINDIDNVSITVENNPISNYPNLLNKKLGINNDYSFSNRNNISKTVIYYLDKINQDYYFVPITKYLNDQREKIEIIINQLIDNEDKSLVSPINNKTKLISYQEDNNVMYLNFNKYLLDSNDQINIKIQEMIAYSIFDNYDVEMVMFEIDGEKVNYIEK